MLTIDVVKGLEHEGFDKPAFPDYRPKEIDCEIADFSFAELSEALQAHRDILKGKALDQNISFIAPSPVYPNIVAIPLMSMERCYGPWLSSFAGDDKIRYADIGGKIDFVKKETLAPWSFAGYQLMNEAGKLEAEFSNSLLLFSERGGFVIPDAPAGISLAKALQVEGPLVTSISVDISNSVKTTVQMNLYTDSFGKLHKQKEADIAQISRERQKIIDRENIFVRTSKGKNQGSLNIYQDILHRFGGQNIIDIAKESTHEYSELETQKKKKLDLISFRAVEDEHDASASPFTSVTEHSYSAVFEDEESFQDSFSLTPDSVAFQKNWSKTASDYLSNVGKPISYAHSPHFPDPYVNGRMVNEAARRYIHNQSIT